MQVCVRFSSENDHVHQLGTICQTIGANFDQEEVRTQNRAPMADDSIAVRISRAIIESVPTDAQRRSAVNVTREDS